MLRSVELRLGKYAIQLTEQQQQQVVAATVSPKPLRHTSSHWARKSQHISKYKCEVVCVCKLVVYAFCVYVIGLYLLVCMRRTAIQTYGMCVYNVQLLRV